MTRTCSVNRLSKEWIRLNVRILECPHLCGFQSRTSLNCKLGTCKREHLLCFVEGKMKFNRELMESLEDLKSIDVLNHEALMCASE